MAKKSSGSGSSASGGSGRSTSSRTGGGGSGGAKRAPAKQTAAKRGTAKRGSGKRELINTGTDKRFARRVSGGQFKESDDVGRSLSSDRRKKAKTVSKAGQGDRGDRKR